MKKYLLLSFLSLICLFSFSQGSESFENNNASGSSYGTGSYTGDNGLIWTYSGARNPSTTYQITSKSIGFGSSGTRFIEATTDANGVGDVTFSIRSYFTGGGSIGQNNGCYR